MEMLMKLFQSIGAIVIGGFLGFELWKIIYIITHRNEDLGNESEDD